jgi:hypothetical protein
MNMKTKKIIAKEFLFLLGATILFFVVLFIWTMLHESNYNKTYVLKEKIEELTEYEKLPYRLKLLYYIKNEVTDDYGIKYNLEDSEKFISELKDKEQASEIYDYLERIGNVSNTKEKYLEKISKDTESEKHLTELLTIEKELEKTKDSFFNRYVGNNEILELGFMIFSMFFLFRYLIYGTKWSIKQLKE